VKVGARLPTAPNDGANTHVNEKQRQGLVSTSNDNIKVNADEDPSGMGMITKLAGLKAAKEQQLSPCTGT
jgi:hypothetical protein